MVACPRRAGLISRIGELRHNTIVILAGEWAATTGGPAWVDTLGHRALPSA